MLSYRDYLIWTAANTAHALSDAIGMALRMEHEPTAVRVLESRLDSVGALAAYRNPSPEKVGPRPEEEA